MTRFHPERRARKFLKQRGLCYWCKQLMTLEMDRKGKHPKQPANFATYEHLQRKRDGGSGKPWNVVLACRRCNNGRDAGVQTSKPKPENVSARRVKNSDLFVRLNAGTITNAEIGELFSRGLIPNWPMWTKLMAHVPLGNP